MNSDEHTCVFKERPEKIYAVFGEAGASEMPYARDFNAMPTYEAASGENAVLLYDDGSWQLLEKQDNVIIHRFPLKIDSSDLLDINGYDVDGLKVNFFDNSEEYERLLSSPMTLEITVDAFDGKPNNFLSGEYEYQKMMNNAQSFMKRSASDDFDILLWSTGDSWVFTEEEMFGKTDPVNWLKLKTLDRSVEYLETDWPENSGDFSKVLIDFSRRYHDITDKIFFDIPAVSFYNEKDHRTYFWIDGNEKKCDASNVIAVSEFTVVNGEVTDSPCND